MSVRSVAIVSASNLLTIAIAPRLTIDRTALELKNSGALSWTF